MIQIGLYRQVRFRLTFPPENIGIAGLRIAFACHTLKYFIPVDWLFVFSDKVPGKIAFNELEMPGMPLNHPDKTVVDVGEGNTCITVTVVCNKYAADFQIALAIERNEEPAPGTLCVLE